MTYTGPELTGPQLTALASIQRRGDTMEVHPAREGALWTRGLIVKRGMYAAELTDDGRQVLAQAARAERVTGGGHECRACGEDACLCEVTR